MIGTYRISGNIFDDPLLFNPADSEILKTKDRLMSALEEDFKANAMTQESAIAKFEISESKAQSLLDGRISQFSIDELVSYLEKCSIHVILKSELVTA